MQPNTLLNGKSMTYGWILSAIEAYGNLFNSANEYSQYWVY